MNPIRKKIPIQILTLVMLSQSECARPAAVRSTAPISIMPLFNVRSPMLAQITSANTITRVLIRSLRSLGIVRKCVMRLAYKNRWRKYLPGGSRQSARLVTRSRDTVEQNSLNVRTLGKSPQDSGIPRLKIALASGFRLRFKLHASAANDRPGHRPGTHGISADFKHRTLDRDPLAAGLEGSGSGLRRSAARGNAGRDPDLLFSRLGAGNRARPGHSSRRRFRARA